LEVLAAREVGVEVGLFGDVAETPLEGLEVGADVAAVEGDAAGGGLEEPVSVLTVVLFPAPLGPR